MVAVEPADVQRRATAWSGRSVQLLRGSNSAIAVVGRRYLERQLAVALPPFDYGPSKSLGRRVRATAYRKRQLPLPTLSRRSRGSPKFSGLPTFRLQIVKPIARLDLYGKLTYIMMRK